MKKSDYSFDSHHYKYFITCTIKEPSYSQSFSNLHCNVHFLKEICENSIVNTGHPVIKKF